MRVYPEPSAPQGIYISILNALRKRGDFTRVGGLNRIFVTSEFHISFHGRVSAASNILIFHEDGKVSFVGRDSGDLYTVQADEIISIDVV